MRKLAFVFVLLMVLVLPVSVYAGPARVAESLDNFWNPDTTYQAFVTTAEFEGVGKGQLFNFMGMATNDPIWFPGVTYSTQLSGDPNGSVGAMFEEGIVNGPFQWTNVMTLEDFERPRYEVQVTVLVESWSLVTFTTGPNGAVWTSYSYIQVTPLLTFEALSAQLVQAYENVAGYYGTTQVSSTVDLGHVTTDANGNPIGSLPFDAEQIVRDL